MDGEGDVCDADDDNDGVLDGTDQSPVTAAATGDGCPYTFDGFFKPIDNGGVLNVLKAGSAVPGEFAHGEVQPHEVARRDTNETPEVRGRSAQMDQDSPRSGYRAEQSKPRLDALVYNAPSWTSIGSRSGQTVSVPGVTSGS